MIKLKDLALDSSVQAGLDAYQATVNGEPDFVTQVEAAKKNFSKRNKADDKVFKHVRPALLKVSSGFERCAYCEDSKADEIEHIKPKDYYPDEVFSWLNYCYACGPCNGPKSNNYAVLTNNKEVIYFGRKHKEYKLPMPPDGQGLIINPRLMNPLEYLFLDLSANTNLGFSFAPMADDESSFEYHIASNTIRILRLNERGYLKQSRKNAFDGFKYRLEVYVLRKKNPNVEQSTLDAMKSSLQDCNHQTVWQEMKRQHDRVPELEAIKQLFEDAPEALNW